MEGIRMTEIKLISWLPRRIAASSPPLEATKGVAAIATAAEPDLTDVETIILVHIARSPNCSRHEVACDLNLSPRVVDESIRSLEKKGMIERKEEWNCVG